jgi:acyl dehydratase
VIGEAAGATGCALVIGPRRFEWGEPRANGWHTRSATAAALLLASPAIAAAPPEETFDLVQRFGMLPR